MPSKVYDIPNMPEDEAHTGFHAFLDKLRSIGGVHDVTVDRTTKQVTVHVHNADPLQHVDQAVMDFGVLPGFTGMYW